MRVFLFFISTIIIVSSCNQNISHLLQKKQDSLFNILHFQIIEFKTLSKQNKQNFIISDSLSSKDSLLYEQLMLNYNKALSTIDSIQMMLPNIISESDSLLKNTKVYDTIIINRLNYLVYINKNYLKEYYKAHGIIEQNKKLLEIVINPH